MVEEENREENVSVTFRFVSTNNLTTKIIQTVTRGWPSHCEVLWDGERTSGRYLGSQPTGGVQIRHADYLTPIRIEYVTLPLTFTQESGMRRFLYDQIGKPYDWGAVLALGVGANWRMPGHWFCSDLLDAPLEKMRFLRDRTPPNRVSPAQLLIDLKATPGVVCSG